MCQVLAHSATLREYLDQGRMYGRGLGIVRALLTKPQRRKVDLPTRYVGFEIPDRFVVGYGFDLATTMAREALKPVNALATGTIRLNLYKGSIHFDAATDVPLSSIKVWFGACDAPATLASCG